MSEAETCRALTTDGSRCSRPAQADGFCYQHDEDDPTVDEESEGADGEPSDEEEPNEEAPNDEESDEQPNDEQSNGQSERTEEEHDMSESDDENGSSSPDLMTVRDTVTSLASDVIGRPLDGIIEMSQDDGEWRAVVEVIERRSVPDTQDILGRYEIDVGEDDIVGYRRLERYRRGDTTQHEL